MPWHLYLALRHLFPMGRKLSFFTAVSVLGVAAGVGVLIVVLSVMGGFGAEVREKLIAVDGDLRVEARSFFDDYEPLQRRLEADPAVAGVAPYAGGIVLLEHSDRPTPALVKGVEPEQERRVLPVEKFLIAGRVDDLDDDTALVSVGLVDSLGVGLGSEINLYTPLMLERLQRDSVLLPRKLRVAGVFQTGLNQVDEGSLITTLRVMQDLYGLGQGVHGLTVRLKPGRDGVVEAARLDATLPPGLRAVSWLERNQNFQFVLRMEKTLMFLILTVILMVSAFAITSSLWITVVRKTREIGLLGAMGGRPGQVAWCFCWQGLFIGAAGTAIGIAGGVLFLTFRNEILHAIVAVVDWARGGTSAWGALREFYPLAELPVHYAASDFLAVAFFSLLFSVLAGLLPAWRAAQLKPAEALRSE